MAADDAGAKAYEMGLRTLTVQVKGPGSGRETALRSFNLEDLKLFQLKILHQCLIMEQGHQKKESLMQSSANIIDKNWKGFD